MTDLLHPCQVLTDLLTVREHKGKNFRAIKAAYVGDGNNMANSWLYGAAKVGMTFTVATPADYKPNQKVFDNALADAEETGAKLSWVEDPAEAIKDADVVITDTFCSMGFESEYNVRKKIFMPYQVNKKLLGGASKNVIVMHCLPRHPGEEITDEVFEDNAHVIFDEAENRLHTQKAIMALTMG